MSREYLVGLTLVEIGGGVGCEEVWLCMSWSGWYPLDRKRNRSYLIILALRRAYDVVWFFC